MKLQNIAFAVMHHNPKPSYLHFTDATGNYYITYSPIPQLFTDKEAAQKMMGIAENHELASSAKGSVPRHASFSVVPIRLVQPATISSSEQYDNSSRLADARSILPGILEYEAAAKSVKQIAGKVLTILDAAYTNETQNKAVKDLVKSSFRSQLSEIWTEVHRDPSCGAEGCEEGKAEADILD